MTNRRPSSTSTATDDLASVVDDPDEDITAAIHRLLALAAAQGERGDDLRDDLVERLQTNPDLLDPIPRATVDQAQRIASRRNALLASGAWTVAALAQARGTQASSVRTWIARHRAASRIFTVIVNGDTYLPALLLDEAADLRAGTAGAIGPLKTAGLDAWALWVWFTTPSPWLDGQRPAELLADGDADRLAAAAHAQASNVAEATAARNVA